MAKIEYEVLVAAAASLGYAELPVAAEVDEAMKADEGFLRKVGHGLQIIHHIHCAGQQNCLPWPVSTDIKQTWCSRGEKKMIPCECLFLAHRFTTHSSTSTSSRADYSAPRQSGHLLLRTAFQTCCSTKTRCKPCLLSWNPVFYSHRGLCGICFCGHSKG